MKKEIRVFAPASVSNVGCGFDVMGFALESPGDEIVLKRTNNQGVKIELITGDNGSLPYDPKKNTAGAPLLSILKDYGIETGLVLEIHKKMPFKSGLGSSGASSVGAVYAANKLLELNLSLDEMFRYALEGESLSSGTVHADNVAPSLYGGFTLVRGYNPPDVILVDYPKELICVIVHPHIEISTKNAREILPHSIPLNTAVKQWANCSALTVGLMKGDYELIGRSIVDLVAEPVRSRLIPGYESIKRAALNCGAIACSISGSGPSIFAFTRSYESAVTISNEMIKSLRAEKIDGDVFISRINREGPKVISIK